MHEIARAQQNYSWMRLGIDYLKVEFPYSDVAKTAQPGIPPSEHEKGYFHLANYLDHGWIVESGKLPWSVSFLSSDNQSAQNTTVIQPKANPHDDEMASVQKGCIWTNRGIAHIRAESPDAEVAKSQPGSLLSNNGKDDIHILHYLDSGWIAECHDNS